MDWQPGTHTALGGGGFWRRDEAGGGKEGRGVDEHRWCWGVGRLLLCMGHKSPAPSCWPFPRGVGRLAGGLQHSKERRRTNWRRLKLWPQGHGDVHVHMRNPLLLRGESLRSGASCSGPGLHQGLTHRSPDAELLLSSSAEILKGGRGSRAWRQPQCQLLIYAAPPAWPSSAAQRGCHIRRRPHCADVRPWPTPARRRPRRRLGRAWRRARRWLGRPEPMAAATARGPRGGRCRARPAGEAWVRGCRPLRRVHMQQPHVARPHARACNLHRPRAASDAAHARLCS